MYILFRPVTICSNDISISIFTHFYVYLVLKRVGSNQTRLLLTSMLMHDRSD